MGFANAAVDYYNITLEHNGTFSLEFVIATTYALVIIKEVNRFISKNQSSIESTVQMEFEKILNNFDVKLIEKSYTILSKSMQRIFRNALTELDEKKDQLTIPLLVDSVSFADGYDFDKFSVISLD